MVAEGEMTAGVGRRLAGVDPDRLAPYSDAERAGFYAGMRFGRWNPLFRGAKCAWQRLTGRFSFEDQITLASMCEPPMFFLRHGCLIPHAYGITLSADVIGADCYIGQVTTIGTNQRHMRPGDGTVGHKPRIGHLVRIYPNATVSGDIAIGGASLVAAGAIVTRDVPPLSVVYGVNQVKPLAAHHVEYLRGLFHLARSEYRLVPGLVFVAGSLQVDPAYREFCAIAERDLADTALFARHLRTWFGDVTGEAGPGR